MALSMESELRLAFFGCGLIAEHHAVAVERCREAGLKVAVVACIDIDLARAQHLCSLSGHPGAPARCGAEAEPTTATTAITIAFPHPC